MLLGGIPVDKSESSWKKIVFFAFPFIVVIYYILIGTSTEIFIRRSISVSLKDTVSAFLQVAGIIYILYSIIVAFLIRRKINRIFSKLTKIYEKCECNFFFSKISFILFRFWFQIKIRWEHKCLQIFGTNKQSKWVDVDSLFKIRNWWFRWSYHYRHYRFRTEISGCSWICRCTWTISCLQISVRIYWIDYLWVSVWFERDFLRFFLIVYPGTRALSLVILVTYSLVLVQLSLTWLWMVHFFSYLFLCVYIT